MKIFVFRRSVLTALVLLLSAIAILALFGNPAIVGAASDARLLPIYSVDTGGEKRMAISFDTSSGSEDIEALIEILAHYDISATFFAVGDWVDRHPESVRALSAAGHEIMNHSDRHAHMTRLSREEILADIESCNEKIEALIGVRPTLFRAPYGEYDDRLISTVYSAGLYPVQWSIDSIDWKDISAGEIQNRVLSRMEPGAVVLFHGSGNHTPEALPGLLESLLAEGYAILPVSKLILLENYELDNAGRQYPVAAHE